MTVANGALVKAALAPFEDSIFKQARKSGAHERPEAYAADALMALCEIAGVGPIPVATADVIISKKHMTDIDSSRSKPARVRLVWSRRPGGIGEHHRI